jgi:hypothetical protein
MYVIENIHLLDNSSVFYISFLEVRLPEDDFKKAETCSSVSVSVHFNTCTFFGITY